VPHSGMRLNELQMGVTHSEIALQDSLDPKKKKKEKTFRYLVGGDYKLKCVARELDVSNKC